MKKISLIALLTFFVLHLQAQTLDLRRKIEVTGTAEVEVTPDIIYISISLKEYMDGKKKVGIETLERALQTAVLKVGIPKERQLSRGLDNLRF